MESEILVLSDTPVVQTLMVTTVVSEAPVVSEVSLETLSTSQTRGVSVVLWMTVVVS